MDDIKCSLGCSGNKSEICGGQNLHPYSVFDANMGNLLPVLLKYLIQVN